ncbi:MAG: IS1595 family transposase, partial [Acidisphaera sp.]|nr:IS1595 family transposase [Acidisphaera sp.]
MSSKLTVKQFFARFPTDDACLDHVMEVRYGMRHACRSCGKDATFHRLTGRHAYSCAQCGHHVYPCAGTIFQDSRTSLQSWFYAVYLFVATRHGVSGKELERVLGVSYKTAWRMGQQIRKLMCGAEGFGLLQGHIEVDEAYVGGHRPGKRGRGAAGKTIVLGIKEREGQIRAKAIPDAKKETLRAAVTGNVEPGSIVSTDEFVSYGLLTPDGYQHGVV